MWALQNKLSRLGEPYGECSTLDSLKADNQPFYYNGTYSTEVGKLPKPNN